jgi:hypothetical protein
MKISVGTALMALEIATPMEPLSFSKSKWRTSRQSSVSSRSCAHHGCSITTTQGSWRKVSTEIIQKGVWDHCSHKGLSKRQN